MSLLVRILDALHWGFSLALLRVFGFARRPTSGAVQTIVVLRNCFFGDYVVAIPALRAVRHAFPQTRVVLLTATSFAPGWRDLPQDDAMFGIEPGLINDVVRFNREDLTSPVARAQLRARLAVQGPVVSLALVYSADSLLSRCSRFGLCSLLGLPWPFGLTGAHTLPAQTLLNRFRIDRTDITHQKDAALGSVQELLAAQQRELSVLFGSHPARPRTHSSSPVIGIAPFSKQLVKQWPLEHFSALMVELHQEHGASFEIYGASSDAAAAAKLTASLPAEVQAVSMCGTLTPFELRGRIERITLMVALDSGPMHVASLVDTPVVAIFSQITLHSFWQPWGRTSKMVDHAVPCAACNTMNGECPVGTRACIEGVNTQSVLESVRQLLSPYPVGEHPSPRPASSEQTDACRLSHEHPQ